MSGKREQESRGGVPLTNLDEPLFDGAEATKRDLVEYLDAVHDRIIPELEGRPLSVIRVHRGHEAFMQKNVPKYTPEWVRTVRFWAETSKRDVTYALCDDRRTLLWFANQRAVEYHPTLVRADRPDHATHLVLDLDPPDAGAFAMAVHAARLVRRALADVGLSGAVKTSGAKGVHVFVPIHDDIALDAAAAATRAIAARAERLDPGIATTAFMKEDRGGKVFVDSTRAGGATVVAAFGPRVRPGVPVSFPVLWEDLDQVAPGDFTVHTAVQALGGRNPWAEQLPAPQRLSAELVDEGRAIPVARVQAMHEGKRRARAVAAEARRVHPGSAPRSRTRVADANCERVLNHYDVLGIEPTADLGEIRHAWRVKVRLLHPDRHRGSPDEVQAEAAAETLRVNRAWATLRDPETRRRYDEHLASAPDAGVRSGAGPSPRNGSRVHDEDSVNLVSVRCAVCQTTQLVPRHAGRFDCANCRMAWQFAKCESCNAIVQVRERKTRWRCPSCRREQTSSWGGGTRYVFCNRCKSGTYVAPDVAHFNCGQCRLGYVRCGCGHYSPVFAWRWRSWRCPKCGLVNPPEQHNSFDVAQIFFMLVAVGLVAVGVTLLAGLAR